MIHYKSLEEIEKIRLSSLLVSKTLAEVSTHLKEGITTIFIDNFIDNYIKENGAIPAFKNYMKYPFSSCISVNDVVVHGFPNNNLLKNGDVVSIDVGVIFNEYFGDSAYTFIIGDAKDEIKKLIINTKKSLYKGIEQAISGKRLGDISYAIQNETETINNYGVVRDLVGHGIGKNLHEEPQVPNYGKRGKGILLKEGLVIAIEPMINLGTKNVYIDKDNWTVRTNDASCSAHFEHTICVKKDKADILSDFTIIENNISKNKNLWNEII